MTTTETGVISMDALKEATTVGSGQTHHIKLHADLPTSTEVLTSQGQNVVATVKVKREQMSMEEMNALGVSDRSIGSATFKGEKVVTSTQNLPMNMKKVVKEVVTKIYEVQDVEDENRTVEPKKKTRTNTETTNSPSPARLGSPADEKITMKMPSTTVMERISQVGIPAGKMQTGPVQVGPPIIGGIVGERLLSKKVIGTEYRGSIQRSPSPQNSPRTTVVMGGTQILQPPVIQPPILQPPIMPPPPLSPPQRQMTIRQTMPMAAPIPNTIVQPVSFPPPPMVLPPPGPQVVQQQMYYESSYTPRPLMNPEANQIDGMVVNKLIGGQQITEQQMIQQQMMMQQMGLKNSENQGFCKQCMGFIPCLSCLNKDSSQNVANLQSYPRDKACGCFPRGTICCPADGGICCCPCGKSKMTPQPPIPLPPGMMAQLTAPVALTPNTTNVQASFCSLM